MEENGVWRTIGGRRIFIKDGQDLASAMKESGKFSKKTKNENKNQYQLENKLKTIQNRIDEIEDSTEYYFGNEKLSEELDDLLEKRDNLQKEILDEKAKKDKKMIQDKELRDYIYDYTNGDYKIACSYTQYLANGLSEEKAFEKVEYYQNGGFDKLSRDEFKKKVELAQKLSNEIDNQEISNNLLIRFEKTQTDGNYNDLQKKYKRGEEVNWGIRSTSANENYFNKVMSGKDKIQAGSLNSAYPYTYTEYRIIGDKKGLNIAKYSQYKDQDEVLVKGKFIVKDVEEVRPIYVYDKKITKATFEEKMKERGFSYKKDVSKAGRDIIRIYDENNNPTGTVYTYEALLNQQQGRVGYKKEYMANNVDDILSGKVPYYYKEEEVLNEEKSKTDVIPRQIVTLEQILK